MAKSATAKTNGNAPESKAPLFVKDPKALSIAAHGKAGIKRVNGFGYARDTNSVPVTSVEFFEVARSYPIVFSDADIIAPVAILGLEQHNLFLDARNEWLKHTYIPGYIRQYPFLLYKSSDSDQMVLCIDEASDAFAKDSPDMPFYEGDKPSEFSQKALDFCFSYYQQHQGTLAFVNALKEQGLLTARQTNVTLPNGNKVNLGGFLGIDEAKYADLPEKIFLEWRKNGWTMLIDAVILSTINWKYLAQMTVTEKQG